MSLRPENHSYFKCFQIWHTISYPGPDFASPCVIMGPLFEDEAPPSHELLRATARRLRVRTERLRTRTEALKKSSSGLEASTERLRESTERLSEHIEHAPEPARKKRYG